MEWLIIVWFGGLITVAGVIDRMIEVEERALRKQGTVRLPRVNIGERCSRPSLVVDDKVGRFVAN